MKLFLRSVDCLVGLTALARAASGRKSCQHPLAPIGQNSAGVVFDRLFLPWPAQSLQMVMVHLKLKPPEQGSSRRGMATFSLRQDNSHE